MSYSAIRGLHPTIRQFQLLFLMGSAVFAASSDVFADAYSSAVTSTPGLQGYWRLGEASGGFADSGPNGLSGASMTNGGGVSRAVAGPSGANGFPGFDASNTAIGVDRIDGGDWVEIADDDRLDPQTGDWTAEAWFFNDGQNPDAFTWAILGKIEAGDDDPANANRIGYSMLFNYWDVNESVAGSYRRESFGGPFAETFPGIAVTTPGWHHMVSVLHRNRTLADSDYGVSGVSVYIDGVLRDTENITSLDGFPGFNVNNNDGLAIGAFTDLGTFGFRGLIDEVAVYNRALTAAEVAEHYAASQVPEPTALAFALMCCATWIGRTRQIRAVCR